MAVYIVKTGDTVDAVAQKFQVSVDDLTAVNQIYYPYALAVGQALFIPEISRNNPTQRVVVNGYAYPFIHQNILEATLPYLTDLSVFSYGFTGQGELIPPVPDDTWMVALAVNAGVRPVLTLTPLGEDGKFNNQLITEMINRAESVETLINHLLSVMQEKGYSGVDVDFEYILAQDRDMFTSFVARMTQVMNEYGYVVSVALAPKTSSQQQGLLYEGKDYGGLGAAANSVLLMTYEWGYTYGPPMAVAPLNKVREVVQYAVTQIPAAKINLGIPNYGYDWPLPFERGVTKATTIGNIEAVQIAVAHGAVIEFDETAQAPFFHYTQDGIRHEVWFEDVRSMQAKFGLVREFALRGMGYWQLMRLFYANWVLLDEEFVIVRA